MSRTALSLRPGICLGTPPCLDTAFSLTLSWLRPSKISPSMSLLELLQGPVWASSSAPVGGEIIDSSRMKRENLTKVPATLIKVSSHDVNFLGTGTEVGVVAGGPTLLFLRPEETSLINDNYCSVPIQLNQSVGPDSQLFSSETKTNTDVKRLNEQKGCILSKCCRSCSFCNFTRATTKRKGLGPDLSLNKIKVVKGVY